jgi:hypothetical protein
MGLGKPRDATFPRTVRLPKYDSLAAPPDAFAWNVGKRAKPRSSKRLDVSRWKGLLS